MGAAVDCMGKRAMALQSEANLVNLRSNTMRDEMMSLARGLLSNDPLPKRRVLLVVVNPRVDVVEAAKVARTVKALPAPQVGVRCVVKREMGMVHRLLRYVCREMHIPFELFISSQDGWEVVFDGVKLVVVLAEKSGGRAGREAEMRGVPVVEIH